MRPCPAGLVAVYRTASGDDHLRTVIGLGDNGGVYVVTDNGELREASILEGFEEIRECRWTVIPAPGWWVGKKDGDDAWAEPLIAWAVATPEPIWSEPVWRWDGFVQFGRDGIKPTPELWHEGSRG